MGTKRSIIMAGGGVKVAFQAGVLQVWLDEAGIEFDHGDGASGGTFNLAMWCQGMSGTEIADAWRRTAPIKGISINAPELLRLAWARSLFTLEGYRHEVFPNWGLDWKAIQASKREATFNVYNFSKHELIVRSAAQMNEDWLCAGVSLPMWFEPQVIEGDTYIDAVYMTDANLEEAIRRGADEIWVIWTVSMRGEWNDGFIANYFQIIETVANGNFKRICKRIEANNAAMKQGKPGEFGRHIELKILQAEVPIHYLVDFSQDRLVECVNLGVQQARAWCQERKIRLRQGADAPTSVHNAQTKLQFSEVMKGFVAPEEKDYDRGFQRGQRESCKASVDLTIKIDGINRFITEPNHEAAAVGYVDCAAFGGRQAILEGKFNLLVDAADPRIKTMYYQLWFQDNRGKPLTLLGFKSAKDDPGIDVWSDTTTLFTRILEGHRTKEEDDGARVLASGILKLHHLDFLKELTTFRVDGPTLADRAAALARFGRLFFGKLWDVYATRILSSGPV